MQHNRRTLEELNLILFDSSNQERIFTVEATINVVNIKFGWYYISCSDDNCKKQLDKNGDHYFCKKCDKKAQPKARYKIKLEISDSTANATYVLFDKEAQMLISESADFMIASVNHDNKEVPKSLQKIYGETLIFQFRLTEYNFTSCRLDYTVSRIFIPNEKGNSTIEIKSIKESTLRKNPKGALEKQVPHETEIINIPDDVDNEEHKGKQRSKRIGRRHKHVQLEDGEVSESQNNSTKLQRKRKSIVQRKQENPNKKVDITNYSLSKMESTSMAHVKEEPEDSDVSSMDKSKCEENRSSLSKLQCGKQTRRRYMAIEDDSDEIYTETPENEGLEIDSNYAKQLAALEKNIRIGERLAKKIDGKKSKNIDAKCKKTVDHLKNKANQGRPKRTKRVNQKYTDIF
ncbi:uncharacterized protein LOC133918046 [Phragmites australis]|uniref:uncharacterized protein LOC133918046 n=1 Tax=Phragmites australis TaxID=29695 RepID=UPI002D7941F2|nr:uncharacterized protein LOC133918046 [Phragmites australis]